MRKDSDTAVVILNWNNLEDTSRCLESLSNADVAVYLADNGSTDGSKEALWEKYKNSDGIFLIDNGQNLGFSAGCNIALEQAYLDKHKYFILLNNDCIVPNVKIFGEVESLFSGDSSIGIVGGKILFWPDTNLIWSTGGFITYFGGEVHIGHKDADNGSYDGVFDRSFISGAFMCIKREVIQSIGLLPEAYFFGKEEWEYSTRAIDAGYRLIYDSRLVIWHEASSSHEWTDPFYVWNGNLSKIIYKKRNYSPFYFSLWLMLYWLYNFFAFPLRYRILRDRYVKGISPETIRRVTLKAIYDSFKIKKISLKETKNFREWYNANL